MSTQQNVERGLGNDRKRKFRFRGPPGAITLSAGADHYRQMLTLLSEIGVGIVREARGPVPLLTFGSRVLGRLQAGTHSPPPAQFADALKRTIREMRDNRLRVVSPTDFLGVGYVYNADEPETWPVRLSRLRNQD